MPSLIGGLLEPLGGANLDRLSNQIGTDNDATRKAASAAIPVLLAALARNALDVTFLHWGLHAWAIYVVVGLAMAYAVHRKGRPVSIRWALEPLLGKRVTGAWGDAIAIIAVVGTLFGVATSLGFGVTQVGAGLAYLGVVDEPTNTLLVVLIAAITTVALISVVTGVDMLALKDPSAGLLAVIEAAFEESRKRLGL